MAEFKIHKHFEKEAKAQAHKEGIVFESQDVGRYVVIHVPHFISQDAHKVLTRYTIHEDNQAMISLVKQALKAQYGSSDSIRNQEIFFKLAKHVYKYDADKDEEAQHYFLKATEKEIFIYVLEKLEIPFEKEHLNTWEEIGNAKS